MRQVFCGLVLGVLMVPAGCSSLNPRHSKTDGHASARRWDRQPTAASMVAYLNDNARLIPALTAEDVTLDCRAGKDSGVVTGRLDCQRPRNFRLTGKVVGQPMVDMGSNDQEFWYWIGKASPYVFHCSHEAMGKGGVRLPFPVQPELLLTTLGVSEYDPNKKYDVRVNGQTVELIDEIASPQGTPLQKVTVFNRNPRGDQPTVAGYILRDGQGRKICEATITAAKRDAATGAELPRRIHIVCPDQKQTVEMKMQIDSVRVATPSPQEAGRLYNRRNLSSSPGFDLARGAPDAPQGQGELERVGNPPR